MHDVEVRGVFGTNVLQLLLTTAYILHSGDQDHMRMKCWLVVKSCTLSLLMFLREEFNALCHVVHSNGYIL